MATIKPIRPEDIAAHKQEHIPEAVFQVFNDLIAENINAGYATVRQKDVVKRMKAAGLKEKDISDKGWLDVEPVYRDAGWEVSYDKPAYCESWYEPYYTFRAKR